MKLHRNCEGNHPDVLNALSRRDFMHIGMVGTLGLSLPTLFPYTTLFRSRKSVV